MSKVYYALDIVSKSVLFTLHSVSHTPSVLSEVLHKQGVDIGAPDFDGRTPAHAAARRGMIAYPPRPNLGGKGSGHCLVLFLL